ncbi:hypothetical protein AOLI_G00232620 [Acnodon oligacanthus]
MSSVKEECEDVSVMEASGLKMEDKDMETGMVLQSVIKEEFKVEVEPVEEECSDPTFSLSSVDSTGPRVKMSCVKEECEDVSVMEASGLKTEDEMKEEPLFQDTEEECKPDVKPFPEEYSAPISDLNTEQETSFSAADVLYSSPSHSRGRWHDDMESLEQPVSTQDWRDSSEF